MANTFPIPSFGPATNSGYSPKTYQPSPQTYQPMPKIEQPSFGLPYGRPQTPSQHGRHTSYTKGVESDVQSVQPSVERVRRHREYYLDGGDIIFLVENYLFRVHRYFFERESPVFRKQLADAAHGGHHRIGMSDTDPCVLHDVRTEDFSRFLWVFYNPLYSIYEATTEDWAAILGLAHHWQFSEIKALVVRELEKQVIPSITKIVIYHRYGVDRNLLLPAYTDLCQRENTLDYEEAKDLGLETSLMIMTAREVVRKGDGSTSATVALSQNELQHVIRQIFRFPGPRSDTPMSNTSEVTVAEPSAPANASGYSDHNQPLEKPSDLPPIQTETMPSEPTPVAADTTQTEIPTPETATSGPSTEETQKQQRLRPASPPPVISKEPSSSTPRDSTEPQIPNQGSQFDENRPTTPTTGQSVATMKTGVKAKKGTRKLVPGVARTPVTREVVPMLPPKIVVGSAKGDGTKVDVAGNVRKTDVKDEEKKVEKKKVVNMTDSRPGDDVKIDTQQAQEPFGSVDAPQSTADNLHKENFQSLLDDCNKDNKKIDVAIPWPLLDADRAGTRSPITNDQDKTATTTSVAEVETITTVPEVGTAVVLPVAETTIVLPGATCVIPAVDATTTVPEVDATTVVPEVASDVPPSVIIVDVPPIQDPDATPIKETTTDKVIGYGDVVNAQKDSASATVILGQDDDEGECLMARKQRFAKEREAELKPTDEQIVEDLVDLSSELTQLVSTFAQNNTEEETNKGVNYVQFSLIRDVPMSDDDDLFLDCDSTASVSNFDGL